jgi:DNA gyrase inhibitor GyrI
LDALDTLVVLVARSLPSALPDDSWETGGISGGSFAVYDVVRTNKSKSQKWA